MDTFGKMQTAPITMDGIIELLKKEGGIFIALIERIETHIIGSPLQPQEVAIFDLELENIGVPIARQVADHFASCFGGEKNTFRLVKGYHLLNRQAVEFVRDCVAREYVRNLEDVLGQLFKSLMELEEIKPASIMTGGAR
ncbi:MAG: hypothetical protein ABSF47_00110 [Minisyncoccia bacterium]|jgi:hypothetical protein